jgi:pyruvate kinase
MLETMTRHPAPSSAEVADVTNAILDGADGICLSSETGIGHFPVITVETANRIILEAELFYMKTHNMSTLSVHRRDSNTLGTLAYGAVQYVLSQKAKLICL